MKLQELKKLAPEQLAYHWSLGRFPFDLVDKCDICLTQHGTAGCQRHAEMGELIPDLGGAGVYKVKGPSGEWLARHLDELYALRLYFRRFYRDAPDDVDAEQLTKREVEHVHQ